MNECIEYEIVDAPIIQKKPGNCGAGIVIPPEPPVNLPARTIGVFETSRSKLFYGWLYSPNNPFSTLNEQFSGSPNYYGSIGNEYYLHLFNFDIPAMAQRGDKVVRATTVRMGPVGVGLSLVFGAGAGGTGGNRAHTYDGIIQEQMRVGIQLGSQKQSWADMVGDVTGILVPDSLALWVPKVWQSLDGITIQSWNPFSATCCIKNKHEAGEPPWAITGSWNRDVFNQLSFGTNSSPANWGIYNNQQTELLFHELGNPFNN